jgi:streptogramin lyase
MKAWWHDCIAIRVACLMVCSALVAPVMAASPIAPGDIVFTEFFDGWFKLDPSSGQVTALPWAPAPVFTQHLAFDIDGAILFDGFEGAVSRLNPHSGNISPLNIPGLSFTDGFVVEPNGDLLIANNQAVSRFSRTAHTTTTVTTGTFFSPNGITRTADGRVFITEFFEDLWEINPATGAKSHVTSFAFSIPMLIATRSDGDLIVENFSPDALYRVDPDTGAVSPFTDDLPTFVRNFALDANDNLWLTSSDGIYRYSGSGGAKTLIASGTFFSPKAIAIVPPGWTPPVPEPSTLVMALIAALAMWRRHRS